MVGYVSNYMVASWARQLRCDSYSKLVNSWPIKPAVLRPQGLLETQRPGCSLEPYRSWDRSPVPCPGTANDKPPFILHYTISIIGLICGGRRTLLHQLVLNQVLGKKTCSKQAVCKYPVLVRGQIPGPRRKIPPSCPAMPYPASRTDMRPG